MGYMKTSSFYMAALIAIVVTVISLRPFDGEITAYSSIQFAIVYAATLLGTWGLIFLVGKVVDKMGEKGMIGK